MSDKKDKIIDLVEQLQDLCPGLNKVVVDDLEDPTFIFISEERNFELFDEILNGKSNELLQRLLNDPEMKKMIGFDDDDEGSGTLH